MKTNRTVILSIPHWSLEIDMFYLRHLWSLSYFSNRSWNKRVIPLVFSTMSHLLSCFLSLNTYLLSWQKKKKHTFLLFCFFFSLMILLLVFEFLVVFLCFDNWWRRWEVCEWERCNRERYMQRSSSTDIPICQTVCDPKRCVRCWFKGCFVCVKIRTWWASLSNIQMLTKEELRLK